jgi:hypothetical protein
LEEKMEVKSAENPSWLARLIAQPHFPISGWLVGLIGLIATIYFYFAALEKPELTYYVRPDRTALVAVGDTPDLLISYKGRPLSSTVSAAQITIWNAGKRPIRQEDVLTPFVISMGEKHPILTAKVVNVTSPVLDFRVDDRLSAKGLLRLDWRVLEHSDAAQIQVIYEGDTDSAITLTGVSLGQRNVELQTSPAGYESKRSQSKLGRINRYLTPIAALLVLVSTLSATILQIQIHRKRPSSSGRTGALWRFTIMSLFFLGLFIFMSFTFYQTYLHSPPFGY